MFKSIMLFGIKCTQFFIYQFYAGTNIAFKINIYFFKANKTIFKSILHDKIFNKIIKGSHILEYDILGVLGLGLYTQHPFLVNEVTVNSILNNPSISTIKLKLSMIMKVQQGFI